MNKILLLISLIGLICTACNEIAEPKTHSNIPPSSISDNPVPIEPALVEQPATQNSNGGQDANVDAIDAELNPEKSQDLDEIGDKSDNSNGLVADLGNNKENSDENSGILGSEYHRNDDFMGEDSSTIEKKPFPEKDIAQPIVAVGLPNLYKVSSELYRSGQPVKNGLTSAQKLGIKTVLTLQLISFDIALDDSESSGLVFEHVPMVPSSVSEEDLIKALKIIHSAQKPVLVHCLHGSDRTGITVAMYRIVFQNWSKDEAKTEMLEEQFGYHPEFENLLELLDSIDIEAFKKRIFTDSL